jgi:site-specific DNA-cytosine methylase
MSVQLQMFGDQSSQELTSSLLEVLAKISHWQENDLGWKDKEVLLSSKQLGSFTSADLVYLCGKMLKEHSAANNGADFWAIIQAFANIGGYRLEWQLLNTSWFLPQNRERIYLVGYSTSTGGDWRGVFPIGEGSELFNSKKRNEGQESTSVQNEDNIARALNSRPAFGQGSEDTFIKVIDKRGNDKQGTNASTLVAGYYKQPSDGDYIKVKSATSQGYEHSRGRR